MCTNPIQRLNSFQTIYSQSVPNFNFTEPIPNKQPFVNRGTSMSHISTASTATGIINFQTDTTNTEDKINERKRFWKKNRLRIKGRYRDIEDFQNKFTFASIENTRDESYLILNMNIYKHLQAKERETFNTICKDKFKIDLNNIDLLIMRLF